MKRTQITLIAIAALAAIGSGTASYRLLLGTMAEQRAASQTQLTEILVARRALRAGDALQPEDMGWQLWPTSSLAPGMIRRADKPDAGKHLAGVRLAFPVAAGQPLSPDMTVAEGGILSGRIRPGYRAVAIRAGEEIIAGGFLAAGDRVDVIVIEKARSGRRARGQTVLGGARVLAAPSSLKGGRSVRHGGGTVVLEVTPAEAEMLGAARLRGELSLALAGGKDDGAGRSAVADERAAARETGFVSLIKYGVNVMDTSR